MNFPPRPAPRLSAVTLGALMIALPAFAAEAPSSCEPPPVSTLVINVKDKGAKGDGKTDDTAAIQAAIDAIGGTKGTVLVPEGVYMIDAVKHRLHLKDDMTLELAEGAVLKAIPNDSKKYSLLTISGVANVWVVGGTLEGERDQHRGKSGEWGYGLHISKGAKHVTVSNLVSEKMWGDGFYVQDAEDVRFCGVTADANRRQGLSIIEANRLLVLNSVFKNTHGTRPSAGIDLEPDKGGQGITNVRIVGSKFLDNEGDGITVGGKKARIAKVEMIRNVFRNNRPFVLEYAPNLAASICGNRQVNTQTETGGGFNAYAEPIDVVALQNDCGDPSFVIDKIRKKKKKKPGAD
jgi:pectate lyase-like protein